MSPRHAPSLYQINTRVWLTERHLGRYGDSEQDRIAGLGFEWVWLLSVWQTGPAARRGRRS